MSESINGILSDSALTDFWSKMDGQVLSAISKMDEVDDQWTSDKTSEVIAACDNLSRILTDDKLLKISATDSIDSTAENIALVLDVVSNLKTARGLRIFRWFEQCQPDFATELVNLAADMEDNPSAALFVERIDVLNKLDLISRIFSLKRLKYVIERLSQLRDEGMIASIHDEDEE